MDKRTVCLLNWLTIWRNVSKEVLTSRTKFLRHTNDEIEQVIGKEGRGERVYVLAGHWDIGDENYGTKIFAISHRIDDVVRHLGLIYQGKAEPWIAEHFEMERADFSDTHLEVNTPDFADYANLYITEELVI